jgi:hypothetical protein
MKECIKHTEGAERMGNAMKELVSTRSSLKDFMDGFDTIFYDDQMVENIIRSLESELEDEDEWLVTWFYEYRIMGILGIEERYLEVTIKEEFADTTFRIGINPEEDDKNLSDLYDAITRNR